MHTRPRPPRLHLTVATALGRLQDSSEPPPDAPPTQPQPVLAPADGLSRARNIGIDAALFPFLHPGGMGAFRSGDSLSNMLCQRMQRLFSPFTLVKEYLLVMFQVRQQSIWRGAPAATAPCTDVASTATEGVHPSVPVLPLRAFAHPQQRRVQQLWRPHTAATHHRCRMGQRHHPMQPSPHPLHLPPLPCQVEAVCSLVNGVHESALYSCLERERRNNPHAPEHDHIEAAAKDLVKANVVGSPAYHRAELHNLLAIVDAYGIPSLFLTLTADEASDMRWGEVDAMEGLLHSTLGDNSGTWQDIPVEMSRHFTDRVNNFMRQHILCKDDPILGNVLHHTVRYESQVKNNRGKGKGRGRAQGKGTAQQTQQQHPPQHAKQMTCALPSITTAAPSPNPPHTHCLLLAAPRLVARPHPPVAGCPQRVPRQDRNHSHALQVQAAPRR